MVETINNHPVAESKIWEDMQCPVLRQWTQQFLFKSMHNTYMIGNKWMHIQHHENRAYCNICHSIESMKHILLNCNSVAQCYIWGKAKTLWPQGLETWPNITISMILGIGSIQPPQGPQNEDDTRAPTMADRGRTRLLQILIAEASHLIWVIRCERTIQNKQYMESQLEQR